MKQIIPFKKDLPFRTKVSEITSISLEREIDILDEGIVTGTFHISGDYKMNEGSINREKFSFELPFDITLDPRYDIETVKADIEDFYYDVVNEDTLKVNIDLFVEADYLPEDKMEDSDVDSALPTAVREKVQDDLDSLCSEEDRKEEDVFERDEFLQESETVSRGEVFKNEEERGGEIEFEPSVKYEEVVKENLSFGKDENANIAQDLFSNLDDTETYTTYYVYVVEEEDTIQKIMTKYEVTKEEIENYNDITDIKPGDKIIIPKSVSE